MALLIMMTTSRTTMDQATAPAIGFSQSIHGTNYRAIHDNQSANLAATPDFFSGHCQQLLGFISPN